MNDPQRKRIVILGGGFGGVYTALYLEKALTRRDDFEIVLINKENYFVFQPMLAEIVSGNIGLLDTVSPIRRLLPRTDLHVREVESINLEQQTITTTPGLRLQPSIISYDHLVLALGNVTDFRGLRGLPEHAIPFKNLGDALFIRNHTIHALEEAAIEHDDAALRQKLLTFVVAGGGFSGVEVVAELNDFVRDVIRNYRQLDPKEVRVVLLHSAARILPELDEKLALYAQNILKKRGVEILLNTKLQAATGEDAILSDGSRIPTKTLISTVPSSPNPLIDALDLPKERGRLKVDAGLCVEGTENIWALGDCALVPLAGGGSSPPTAQFAIRQARTAAHNIVTAMRGGEKRTFQFKELGKLGALGHRSAVAQMFGVNVSGFLAWFLWRTIYLMKLPGWGRRMKVAASWTFDLFLPPDLVQLKLGQSTGISHEHFEPGQDVFKQGDLGDRLYIIASGRADVVRNEDGREIHLAQLGPGEYFGEMALLNQTTRNATVRCVESLNVLSMHKRDFNLLAANLPAMRQSFEHVMKQRRNATDSKLMQATSSHSA
ncbi:MAG TPA: FAD-dependent oxidoreductase [Pyrinomonadaceae bacterium]|nr:FAD-dependent oxidoreductase [Pyrinomonadaceae bacterium]